MTEVQPDLDRTLSRRFAAPEEDARVTRIAAALEANGITVLCAPNRADAKRIVLDLILAGSQVHQGAPEPLADARPQAAYGVGSGMNRVLIVNREWTPGSITVVLRYEALGF